MGRDSSKSNVFPLKAEESSIQQISLCYAHCVFALCRPWDCTERNPSKQRRQCLLC